MLFFSTVARESLFAAIFSYPCGTKQVNENIYAVKCFFWGDFYAYKSSGTVILFDAGLGLKNNLKKLAKFGIGPEDIGYVFLTHSDLDHAGGVKFFPNAKVYISKDEEKLIDGTRRRFLFYRSPGIKRPYELLKPGDIINIGNIKIEVITASGHTPGSVAYLVNNNILFTGDAVVNGVINRFFNRILNMDNGKEKETYKRLNSLENLSIICTPHSGITIKHGK